MSKPALRTPTLPEDAPLPPEVAKLAQGARGSSHLQAEAAVEPVRAPQSLDAAALAERVPDKQDDTKPLHLRIPKPLHKQLKFLGALTGVTMTEIVLDCLGPEVKRRIEKYNRGG
jgi:hypothetical protein